VWGAVQRNAWRFRCSPPQIEKKGFELAKSLETAMREIRRCETCQIFCEMPQCQLCADPKRNDHTLCVVESPRDVLAIEKAGNYKGRYFVLMGHLSPIDGIGPSEIGIEKLLIQFETHDYKELIIATNPTVEGETTAHYITQLAKKYDLTISRIAHGVPLGSELGFIDSGTLNYALRDRKIIE